MSSHASPRAEVTAKARNRPRCAALGLAWAVVCGCSGSNQGAPDAQSSYVDLYLEDGVEVCGGQLDSYDDFIERVFEFWTDDDPGEFRVAVHADEETPCGQSDACATPGNVWISSQWAQYHEIVHTVVLESDGRSIRALEEGVAQALGSGGPLALDSSQLAGVDPAYLFREDITGTEYNYAGVFVRFLVEEYGLDAFRSYFRALGAVATPGAQEVRLEFERAFGEDLDDAWSVFVSQPRCGYQLWFCEDIRPIELPYALDRSDCTGSDLLGFDGSGLASQSEAFRYAPVEVFNLQLQVATTLAFATENVTVEIGVCGDCTQQVPTLYLGATTRPETGEFTLSPATYVFVVYRISNDSSRFELTARD